MSNVHALEPVRTDAVAAQEYRDRLMPLMDQVSAIFSEAKAEGYIINFNIQPDSFGRRFRCVEISVSKVL